MLFQFEDETVLCKYSPDGCCPYGYSCALVHGHELPRPPRHIEFGNKNDLGRPSSMSSDDSIQKDLIIAPERSTFGRQFCDDFLDGYCPRGDRCHLDHDFADKTVLCKYGPPRLIESGSKKDLGRPSSKSSAGASLRGVISNSAPFSDRIECLLTGTKCDTSEETIREFYGRSMSSEQTKRIQKFWRDKETGHDILGNVETGHDILGNVGIDPVHYPRYLGMPKPAPSICEICGGQHQTWRCSYRRYVSPYAKVRPDYNVICMVCGSDMDKNYTSCTNCVNMMGGFVEGRKCQGPDARICFFDQRKW